MLVEDKTKPPAPQGVERTSPLSQRQDEAVSVVQTLKKHELSLPLSVSPVEAGSHNNSLMENKCAIEDGIGVQEEMDGNSFKQTPSPDPSDLPPWQQTGDMDSEQKKQEVGLGLTPPKLGTGSLSPVSVASKQFLSPSPFPIKDQDGHSPAVLHSTPILSRRRSGGVCELDCSPGSEGSHLELVYHHHYSEPM